MKELSSPLTFFYKFVFILIWILGFGAGTHEVLLSGPDNPKWIQYVTIWAMFAVFIFFSTGHVKKVKMDKKKLIVSNFFKTVEIPLSHISAVDGSTFLSPRLVWFELSEGSDFGKKISFIPAMRKARGIGKHPMVHELAKELDL